MKTIDTTARSAMKLATEFNRYFTSMNGVDVPERVSVPRDEWRALFEALAEQPAQRKPLTDEQIWREYRFLWPFHPEEERKLASDILMFARAIEAKLKEKNCG